jgi:hypothetical protein
MANGLNAKSTKLSSTKIETGLVLNLSFKQGTFTERRRLSTIDLIKTEKYAVSADSN